MYVLGRWADLLAVIGGAQIAIVSMLSLQPDSATVAMVPVGA